jgi:hypothetical protein
VTESCSASTPVNEIKLDGTDYIIMREDDVLGVLDAVAEEFRKTGHLSLNKSE